MKKDTPEEVIWTALRDAAARPMSFNGQAGLIMSELEQAGYAIVDVSPGGPGHYTRKQLDQAVDEASEITGDSVTAGAGPDAHCGCGELITMYDGEWMHVFNPELRGTDDHDAHPGDDYEDENEDEESGDEDELELVPGHRNDLGDWCPCSGAPVTEDGTCPRGCHEANTPNYTQ